MQRSRGTLLPATLRGLLLSAIPRGLATPYGLLQPIAPRAAEIGDLGQMALAQWLEHEEETGVTPSCAFFSPPTL